MSKMHQIRINRGVDGVDFGMSVHRLDGLGYVERPERYNEITGWRTFSRDQSLLCYVKDDAVIAIACFAHCWLQGHEIIGMDEQRLVSLLGPPAEIGEALWVSEDRQQQPFEYEEAGLQIWFELGKVVSVFCDKGEN